MGELQGLFVADKESVAKIMNKKVYFGEVLGKHSEIFGIVEESDISILSEDQEFIEKLIEIMPKTGRTFTKSLTVSGYNPFSYLDDDEEE